MKKFSLIILVLSMVFSLALPVAAAMAPAEIKVQGTTVSAMVDELDGNQNRLWITITENGLNQIVPFMIAIDAEGTYPISADNGDYLIYVDTKDNTQIIACYIVSFTSKWGEIISADYSALKNAISAAEMLNKNEYTADSWAILATAYKNGKNVTRNLTSSSQGIIDSLANDVNNAINCLVKNLPVENPADYTALKNAISAAETLNKSEYTADSWAILATAYKNGKNAARNLTTSSQNIIDSLANAIYDAIKDLVRKGKFSLTTGLPTNNAYKPLIVIIDNTAEARPQMNMSMADVVYEIELTNGGYTRYFALYNDNVPKTVGPVRSARMLHVDIYLEWGGALVHHGGQPHAETSFFDYVNNMGTDGDYDGLNSSFFYRANSRIEPYNSVARLQNIRNDLTNSITPRSPLKFSANNPTIKGSNVSDFSITYRADCAPSYRYNKKDGLYYRCYSGNRHIDGATKNQFTCANVIVMRAAYSWYDGDAERPQVALTGENECDYFIGGKHFKGTWRRDSLWQNTVYLDDEGQEVMFVPGQTYIQIIKDGLDINIQ